MRMPFQLISRERLCYELNMCVLYTLFIIILFACVNITLLGFPGPSVVPTSIYTPMYSRVRPLLRHPHAVDTDILKEKINTAAGEAMPVEKIIEFLAFQVDLTGVEILEFKCGAGTGMEHCVFLNYHPGAGDGFVLCLRACVCGFYQVLC